VGGRAVLVQTQMFEGLGVADGRQDSCTFALGRRAPRRPRTFFGDVAGHVGGRAIDLGSGPLCPLKGAPPPAGPPARQ